MESFFAYSQSTALNHHRFPCQLTDIHDRVFFIGRIIQKYRLFVITLHSLCHHGRIFTYLQSLIARFQAHTRDIRFLILCPGSKHQVLGHLQKKHRMEDTMVYWVVSSSLAQQLQIYRTYDRYVGPFLLEVHSNGYWQLIRQMEPEEDNGHLDWLTRSLIASRQECEQRAQAILQKSQGISVTLVKQCCHSTTPQTTATTSTSWGWLVCPLEIKFAILDQMAIPDIIRCAHAFSSNGLDDIIMTWLVRRLDTHRRMLLQGRHLPVKWLDYHERQLSWLVFQLRPYLISSSSEPEARQHH